MEKKKPETLVKKIKRLEYELKTTGDVIKVSRTLISNYNDMVREKRQVIEILLPLISQPQIEKLLVELHDFRKV